MFYFALLVILHSAERRLLREAARKRSKPLRCSMLQLSHWKEDIATDCNKCVSPVWAIALSAYDNNAAAVGQSQERRWNRRGPA